MSLAGLIRVLTEKELTRVHEASVKVLEETGVNFKLEKARGVFKRHGAKVDGEIVHVSRRMLEKAMSSVPASFTWWARDEKKSVTMGEGQPRPHVSPNAGPIYIEDMDNGRRLGTISDVRNIWKLCRASNVCDVAGSIPVMPHDVPQKERHLRIAHEMIRHVDKPLIGYVAEKHEILTMFEMMETALGRKGILSSKPYLGVSVNPLSPLKYDESACETLMMYAEHGQAVFTLSCAMAGVSAPVTPMGTMVVQNAEMLAGMVLTQLVNPGSPYVYSPASAVPNLANGAYVTGSPESNLINIAGLQLARELYHFPTRCMAGLTDAHEVDYQAGFETMQNLMMLALSGVNILHECLGVLSSIMTTSYEKFIMDEELLSRCLRILEGVDASDDALAVDTIQEVAQAGDYLLHPTTLKACRGNWSPTVSFWGNDDDWIKKGKTTILERANRRYKEVLAGCPESLLDPDVDRAIEKLILR